MSHLTITKYLAKKYGGKWKYIKKGHWRSITGDFCIAYYCDEKIGPVDYFVYFKDHRPTERLF